MAIPYKSLQTRIIKFKWSVGIEVSISAPKSKETRNDNFDTLILLVNLLELDAKFVFSLFVSMITTRYLWYGNAQVCDVALGFAYQLPVSIVFDSMAVPCYECTDMLRQ